MENDSFFLPSRAWAIFRTIFQSVLRRRFFFHIGIRKKKMATQVFVSSARTFMGPDNYTHLYVSLFIT